MNKLHSRCLKPAAIAGKAAVLCPETQPVLRALVVLRGAGGAGAAFGAVLLPALQRGYKNPDG